MGIQTMLAGNLIVETDFSYELHDKNSISIIMSLSQKYEDSQQ